MEQVTMTAAEKVQFEAFRAEQAKKEQAEQARRNRDAYKALVNETINEMFPKLEIVSLHLAKRKKAVYEAFQDALAMKQDIYDVKADQQSNTFTNTEGTRRIILGQYVTDSYDDTVNEGIAKVKEYIGSLAKDAESKMLVDAILRLLSKDKEGNLKASRVMQLRKMADESGSELFADGVKIIEAAYRPAVSKYYVRAEKKNEQGAWVNIPLGMTEA
jgi:hypothetical protein